jgi:hypothetical protein
MPVALWELFPYYAWPYETFQIRTGLLESKEQFKRYALTDECPRAHLYHLRKRGRLIY